jgi:hypothetical protein
VVRQPLHVLDETIDVQTLDGGRHGGVKRAAALRQEACVGDVVGQRVLGSVDKLHVRIILTCRPERSPCDPGRLQPNRHTEDANA